MMVKEKSMEWEKQENANINIRDLFMEKHDEKRRGKTDIKISTK